MRVRYARDYHPAAAGLPGMSMGSGPAAPEQVAELFAAGCRLATLEEPVDLSGSPNIEVALRLVRELTSHGIVVRWRLRLDGRDWRIFSHLYPPDELDGASGDALAAWRSGYQIGRLALRRGPGFVQIRDLRWGGLQRYTIQRPPILEAIEALEAGDQNVPEAIVERLAARHLAERTGDRWWWTPYRMRRWPDQR